MENDARGDGGSGALIFATVSSSVCVEEDRGWRARGGRERLPVIFAAASSSLPTRGQYVWRNRGRQRPARTATEGAVPCEALELAGMRRAGGGITRTEKGGGRRTEDKQ